MTIDEYFDCGTSTAMERPIFQAVMAHLETLGPLHVEAVSVGIFIKKSGTFVELRPMARWVALSFDLPRTVSHPRIARRPIVHGAMAWHVVNLKTAEDVDAQVLDWLSESYAAVT
jgi:hypothetical protein